jgi:hypothetical protein
MKKKIDANHLKSQVCENAEFVMQFVNRRVETTCFNCCSSSYIWNKNFHHNIRISKPSWIDGAEAFPTGEQEIFLALFLWQ